MRKAKTVLCRHSHHPGILDHRGAQARQRHSPERAGARLYMFSSSS